MQHSHNFYLKNWWTRAAMEMLSTLICHKSFKVSHSVFISKLVDKFVFLLNWRDLNKILTNFCPLPLTSVFLRIQIHKTSVSSAFINASSESTYSHALLYADNLKMYKIIVNKYSSTITLQNHLYQTHDWRLLNMLQWWICGNVLLCINTILMVQYQHLFHLCKIILGGKFAFILDIIRFLKKN